MHTHNAAAVLLATLAPAAVALGQGTSATVSLTHNDPDGIIQVGDTVSWTLSIGFEGDAIAATSANIEILADNSLGTASDFTYTTDHGNGLQGFNVGTNGGTSNGAGIGLVNFTNWLCVNCGFGGWSATLDNPLVVGAFEFTAATLGTLEYSLTQSQAPTPLLELGLSAFNGSFTPDETFFELDTLTIVPAPSSALLLAPVGLLAATRRRRTSPATHE